MQSYWKLSDVNAGVTRGWKRHRNLSKTYSLKNFFRTKLHITNKQNYSIQRAFKLLSCTYLCSEDQKGLHSFYEISFYFATSTTRTRKSTYEIQFSTKEDVYLSRFEDYNTSLRERCEIEAKIILQLLVAPFTKMKVHQFLANRRPLLK